MTGNSGEVEWDSSERSRLRTDYDFSASLDRFSPLCLSSRPVLRSAVVDSLSQMLCRSMNRSSISPQMCDIVLLRSQTGNTTSSRKTLIQDSQSAFQEQCQPALFKLYRRHQTSSLRRRQAYESLFSLGSNPRSRNLRFLLSNLQLRKFFFSTSTGAPPSLVCQESLPLSFFSTKSCGEVSFV